MITSTLKAWSNYGNRKYVAIIDMSQVPRNDYQQINRGFKNKSLVSYSHALSLLPLDTIITSQPDKP